MPLNHAAEAEALSTTLRAATAAIGDEYFYLPIDGGIPIYRERVYCYELYHQMRKEWPQGYPYVLNGEVDKRAHPLLSELCVEYTPDFLIHTPGDMAGNSTIIEVKHARVRTQDIPNDLRKLDIFISRVQYRRAIYLIYGWEANEELVATITQTASDMAVHSPVEVLLHQQSGCPAFHAATLNVR